MSTASDEVCVKLSVEEVPGAVLKYPVVCQNILKARCTMSDQNRGSRELRSDCEPSSELRSRTVLLHQIKLGSKGHGSKFDRDQTI